MKRFFYFPATKLITPTVLVVSALLGCTQYAEGTPIYSQVSPEEPSGAFSSQGTPTGQKSADNFKLSGTNSVQVRSLRLIGGCCRVEVTTPVDNFRVVFLEDDEGKPGLPVVGGDFLIGPAYQRVQTDSQLLNGIDIPIEYIINLQDGVSLDPGVVYWVSVINDIGPTQGWTWARANGLLDSNTAATFGDVTDGFWNVFDTGGMWFELNDQVIPEPASFFLISIVLAVATLNRHRYLGGQRGVS